MAFNVCRRCGQYRAEKEVDLDGPYAVCPECGYRQKFTMLPLLIVCGPAGGGKSTVLDELLGKVTTAVLLEGDLLWHEAFNSPQDNYADFFEMNLRLAKNVNQSGRPVVLFNSGAIPSNIESRVERRYFGKSFYLALVCEDAELERRLRARPSWRDSGEEVFIDGQISFNRWFKESGGNQTPPVELLDTTTAAEWEAAAAVALWIEKHLAGSESGT